MPKYRMLRRQQPPVRSPDQHRLVTEQPEGEKLRLHAPFGVDGKMPTGRAAAA
jgi:hypothetical protein